MELVLDQVRHLCVGYVTVETHPLSSIVHIVVMTLNTLLLHMISMLAVRVGYMVGLFALRLELRDKYNETDKEYSD